MLSTSRTASAIAAAIAESHRGASLAAVEKDVEEFLANLRTHEMIVESRS